jgi:hypothetical protein
MDIKEILKTKTGLSVEKNHFVKPPKLPYITFIQDKEIRGISNDNLIIDSDVSVELYTSLPDEELENKVRKVIINDILKTSQNDDEVEIVQMTEYIESEQMYLTNFDFNLIEKGGN